VTKPHVPSGFERAIQYPLLEAIFNRRSRRVARGVQSVKAGSLSYTSELEAQPLEPLEEAVFIAAIGRTGRFTPPDRPFQDERGANILGSPNSSFAARTAGSADNGQMTHFFMMNDSGVYYLDHSRGGKAPLELTAESLLANADAVKVKLAERRLEFPRRYPFYLDSNRFLSNVPGSTLFIPVVDSTGNLINLLLYGLQFPPGQRPLWVDELNGFRPLAPRRWLDNGFLSDNLRVNLNAAQRFRIDVEVHLLLQNLSLTAQALGLGGWIHASPNGRHLLGHPGYTTAENRGLGFRWTIPDRSPLPNANLQALGHAVGLDGVIQGFCPPYYPTMSDAVDAWLKVKFDPETGVYRDRRVLGSIFKGGLEETYIAECPGFSEESIECVKDICEAMYETHGRFPAPFTIMDAMHAPGIWFQAHHLDLGYYDALFRDGYSSTQRDHDCDWHSER